MYHTLGIDLPSKGRNGMACLASALRTLPYPSSGPLTTAHLLLLTPSSTSSLQTPFANLPCRLPDYSVCLFEMSSAGQFFFEFQRASHSLWSAVANGNPEKAVSLKPCLGFSPFSTSKKIIDFLLSGKKDCWFRFLWPLCPAVVAASPKHGKKDKDKT